MPRAFGDSLLHISEVDAVVENGVLLLDHPEGAISRHEMIATTISGMIEERLLLDAQYHLHIHGDDPPPTAVDNLVSDHEDDMNR
jgi:hypothetical protein